MRRRVPPLLTAVALVVAAALALAASPTATAEAAGGPAYPVQHVIFGRTQLDLLTTGAWSPYVHEGDSFMLMSGNGTGSINCQALNYWAGEVRKHYPAAPLYAATSGVSNVIHGAPCLDPSLFAGMILVYEPNQPNAPEFTWDHGGTAQILTAVRNLLHVYGLEAWTKISGRAAAGRDHYGDWDYGLFAQILDGMIIQTQSSCRDIDGDGNFTLGRREYHEALDSIREQYAAAGVTKPLAVRVTTSSTEGNPNATPPHGAMQCALAAWAMPEAGLVTLRTAVDRESIEFATTFYRVRENLRTGGIAVSTTAGRSPEPAASDPDAFSPTLTSTGVSLVAWQGGDLQRLSASLGAGNSLWVFGGGEPIGFIAGAPDFVNRPFIDRYPQGMPAGTLAVAALVR